LGEKRVELGELSAETDCRQIGVSGKIHRRLKEFYITMQESLGKNDSGNHIVTC
jgi:hypothetical protein